MKKNILIGLLAFILSLTLVGCGNDENTNKKSENNNLSNTNTDENGYKTVEQIICEKEESKNGVDVHVIGYFTMDENSYLNSTNLYIDYTVSKDVYNKLADKKKSMNEFAEQNKANIIKALFDDYNISDAYYDVDASVNENKVKLTVNIFDSFAKNKKTKQEVLDDEGKDASCKVTTITY